MDIVKQNESFKANTSSPSYKLKHQYTIHPSEEITYATKPTEQ